MFSNLFCLKIKEMASMIKASHRAALLYDGVHVLATALENFFQEKDLTNPQVSCDDTDNPYDLGEDIFREIDSVS